jgi:hypothetical protein
VQTFSFSIPGPRQVSIRTLSYAGGVQNDGTVVGFGGFDPIISLFDTGGNLIDFNDDDFGAAPDLGTLSIFDSGLSLLLTGGTYTVAVTQYDNFANGPTFGDGFTQVGGGNFTDIFGCSAGAFCDVNADNRSPNWAADVDAVPVPAALPLLASAILAAGFIARRRRG